MSKHPSLSFSVSQSDAGKDLLAALVAVLQQEDPAEVGLQEQTSELLRSILDVGALPPLTATDEERTNSEVVAQVGGLRACCWQWCTGAGRHET